MPISRLWGVGPKTELRLHELGFRTVGQMAAANPEALVRQIKWVSTAVLQAASSPASQSTINLAPDVNVPLPALPAPPPGPAKADDVW